MGSAVITAVASAGATVYTQRGNWTAGTAYAVNDMVQYYGSTYLVTVAHTAASGTPPVPTGTTNYTLFAQGLASGTTAPPIGSGIIWVDTN